MKPFAVAGLLVATVIAGLPTPASAQPAKDPRPKLVMLIAGQSYETDRTLPAFAARFLEAQFQVVICEGAMTNPANRFERSEEIADADILVVSVWRRAPPREQLALIRRHVESGKPVVGIATSSHAFTLRQGASPASGSQDWPEWGPRVIGANYTSHHPIRFITTVTAMDPADPLLAGVTLPFTSKMELNLVRPLSPGAHAFLTGTIEGQAPEPVAWTFQHYGGGKTFFTPLGHPEDFTNPAFQRLLLNGIRWAAGLPVTAADPRKR